MEVGTVHDRDVLEAGLVRGGQQGINPVGSPIKLPGSLVLHAQDAFRSGIAATEGK